jgi:hypothetical protein
VLTTGRFANIERLRDIPGVVVPYMTRMPRKRLAAPGGPAALAAAGFGFPLLLRAPGFHTGRHFVRIARAEDLAAATAALPDGDLWVISQLDARDRNGRFSKCRVMFIDGALYPLHLAISEDWKVHYFTAGMAGSAEHRAQDAAFLDDMAAVVGERGMAALARIRDVLGLHYGGVDFAVGQSGDILFFEANATMAVYPPTADEKWAYRRPAVARVIAAVQSMLSERARAAAARR